MTEIINSKKKIKILEKINGIELVDLHYKNKKVAAIKADEILLDLRSQISPNVEKIEFIEEGSSQYLEILRHDCAHLLAQAILQLDKNAQFGIGPTTDTGCFYDFYCKESIKEEQFAKIEKTMHKLAAQNYKIERITLKKQEAIEFFTKQKQPYKVDLINQIDQNEDITIYKQGNFSDLCRGPHSLSTKHIKYFKITKISGVYWKGDKNNQMMQRIYLTVWNTKEDLDDYIKIQKEAKERDHREIGKKLNLFHFEEHSPGMVFWHKNGFTILNLLQNYIREKQKEHGYEEVQTPILCSEKLWIDSGHMEKFKENMFITEKQNNDQGMAVKPMNCPCHIEIFKQGIKSYKDLPIKMSEFGRCHRNESSGSMHGLLRVRNMIQDDGHIFCTEDQILQESISFFKMIREIYNDLGFNSIKIKLATRPKIRLGSEQTWDIAEKSLENAIKATNLNYEISEGEGAFYGPKIEFHLEDALKRSWQCGTLQLDFILSKNMKAYYIDSDNSKKHPIILHRAALGSFERFIGVMLEHYKGKLPIFLAPVQISLATVTSASNEYARNILQILTKANIRAELNETNNTIGNKIRTLIQQKVPLIAIIGEKEVQNKTVNIRDKDNNIEYKVEDLIEHIKTLENK